MTAITFDTLKFVHRLRDSGMPEQQAEAIAVAFYEASGEAGLAAKAGMRELRQEMMALKTEIIGELKLTRWMLGLLLAGVMSLILKAFF